MKKDYISPEIEVVTFSAEDVLNDGYSGFWGPGVDFDDFLRAVQIGNNTYKG